jgi:hypothetical protein
MAQQLDRADLHAHIEERYPDNFTEEITPQRLRDGLHEIVDSAFNLAEDSAPSTGGSGYFAVTFRTSMAGVQTISPKEVPALAKATDVIQVGVVAADNTLDPEFAPGSGYSFDVATHTLSVFAGDKVPGDLVGKDLLLSIKCVTGPLTSAPGGPSGPVGFADLTGVADDNPDLAARLADLAPSDSPRLTGEPLAATPAANATGYEIANVRWVRNFLLSQLGLSPFASRIIYVCGRGQSTPGEIGNFNLPFATLKAAHDVAVAGDRVIVLPGGSAQDAFGRVYYPEVYRQITPLSVYFAPGAIYGGDIFAGDYFGNQPASHYFNGGEFLARILHARQSGGQSMVLVENAKFTGALGGVQYFANLNNGTGGAHVDQFTIRGCTFDSRRGAGSGAPIRNNGTPSFGDCDMIVDNCLVMSTETPCVIYSSRPYGVPAWPWPARAANVGARWQRHRYADCGLVPRLAALQLGDRGQRDGAKIHQDNHVSAHF